MTCLMRPNHGVREAQSRLAGGDGSTGGSKYDKNQELWSVYGVPGTILSILSVLSHIIFHNSELSAVLQMRKQDQ